MMIDPDAARARIEADRVVGGGKDDPPYSVAPRRLEQVVAPDDVRAQDRLPRPLDREPAEMDDAVDAGNDPLHGGDLGKVGGDELLVGCEIGRNLQVAQPQARIDALE